MNDFIPTIGDLVGVENKLRLPNEPEKEFYAIITKIYSSSSIMRGANVWKVEVFSFKTMKHEDISIEYDGKYWFKYFRKLKARWEIEPSQDIKAYIGQEAIDEISKLLNN